MKKKVLMITILLFLFLALPVAAMDVNDYQVYYTNFNIDRVQNGPEY